MKSRIYSTVLWLILIVAGIVLLQAIKNQAKFEQQQIIIQCQAVKIDSLQRELNNAKYSGLNFYIPDTIKIHSRNYSIIFSSNQTDTLVFDVNLDSIF
jgi:hypothetical protein